MLLWERPPVVLSSTERSTVLTTTDCLQQFCVTNYECIYRDLDGEDRFTVVLLSEVVSHVGDDHLSLEMVLEPRQSRRLSLLNDSIHHADGQLAEGSIALCEEQAYAYGARHCWPPPSSAAGAVWPHDNASAVPLFLLPELFCGFPRRDEEGPTFYPVACSPQAWAKRRPICSFIAASMTWVSW